MAKIQTAFDPNEKPPVPGQGGSKLPEGNYHLRCEGYEQVAPSGEGKSGGLRINWLIVASEVDGSTVGRPSSNTFWFSPKGTAKFLKPYLDAAGVQYEMQQHPQAGPMLSFDPDHIVGTVVLARTYHGKENDAGRSYNEWTDYQVSSHGEAAGRIQQQPQAQQSYQQPAAPSYGQPQPGYAPQQHITQPSQQQPAWQPQAQPQAMPPHYTQPQPQPQQQPPAFQQQMPQNGYAPPQGYQGAPPGWVPPGGQQR